MITTQHETAMNDTRCVVVDWGPNCVVSVAAELEDAKDADSGSELHKHARLALTALEEALTIADVQKVVAGVSDELRCYINSRLLDRIAFVFKYLFPPPETETWRLQNMGKSLTPGEMCAALDWMDAFQFFLRVEPKCVNPWTASLARLYHRTEMVAFLQKRGVDPIPVHFDTETICTRLIDDGYIPRHYDVILSLENPNPSTPVTVTSNPSDYELVVKDRHVFDPPFALSACVYTTLTTSGPLKITCAYSNDRRGLTKLCETGSIETLQCIGHRVYSFRAYVLHNSVCDEDDDGLGLFRRITVQNRQGWKVDETELRRILH